MIFILDFLQYRNKGSVLIDKKEISDSFLADFESDSKKYYAVVINDNSMVPIVSKGDYLVIKFDKLAHSNFLITEKTFPPPGLFILKNSNGDILIRHIKTIGDDKYNYIYYAFLYMDEESLFNRRTFGEFYFRKGEYKIIGEVIITIRTKPRIINFAYKII